MSDFTTLGVQQYSQECYDLRKENKQLRAENERLRELIHRWAALVAVACDDKIDIETIKQLLSTDSEEE